MSGKQPFATPLSTMSTWSCLGLLYPLGIPVPNKWCVKRYAGKFVIIYIDCIGKEEITMDEAKGWHCSSHYPIQFPLFQFPILINLDPRTPRLTLNHTSILPKTQVRPESILPPSCFIRAITWDLDQKTASLPAHVPAASPPYRTFVPVQLRGKLITWAHTAPDTGHPGTQRTYNLLRAKYWWPNMNTGIHKFISSCTSCAQAKVPLTLPTGTRISHMSNPFQCVLRYLPPLFPWKTNPTESSTVDNGFRQSEQVLI